MNRTVTQSELTPGHPGNLLRRRLLSIQEVSEYIGLSVHTLYTMVSQRRIPFVKVGRLVKFDVSLLDAWIKKRTVMPISAPHN